MSEFGQDNLTHKFEEFVQCTLYSAVTFFQKKNDTLCLSGRQAQDACLDETFDSKTKFGKNLSSNNVTDH